MGENHCSSTDRAQRSSTNEDGRPEHPSREYGETREFYRALGYVPVEFFPQLWDTNLPVLQLAKFVTPQLTEVAR